MMSGSFDYPSVTACAVPAPLTRGAKRVRRRYRKNASRVGGVF